MPLTKEFRETINARADRHPAFRARLYQDAVQTMLDGDLAAGRLLLRHFINATIGSLRWPKPSAYRQKP